MLVKCVAADGKQTYVDRTRVVGLIEVEPGVVEVQMTMDCPVTARYLKGDIDAIAAALNGGQP